MLAAGQTAVPGKQGPLRQLLPPLARVLLLLVIHMQGVLWLAPAAGTAATNAEVLLLLLLLPRPAGGCTSWRSKKARRRRAAPGCGCCWTASRPTCREAPLAHPQSLLPHPFPHLPQATWSPMSSPAGHLRPALLCVLTSCPLPPFGALAAWHAALRQCWAADPSGG